MERSRIKSLALAQAVDEEELMWLRHLSPLTEHYGREIAKRDYHGKRLAYFGHITPQNALIFLPLVQAGAEIAVAACNPDSTDDAIAAYLVQKGIHVYGWQGMSRAEYVENLATLYRFDADYLCDMGGELAEAYLDRHPPVKGGLEATTSGLNRLRPYELPFPVFDWNSIPLKDRLENRFHVGETVWPAFNQLTGMSLFGRHVLVIGFGPVGKGIAERARNLGAVVHATDIDPVRMIEARHHGVDAVTLEEGLKRCEIIATATGVEGVLQEEQLRRVRPGTILFNAGHSNHEIDVDWLNDRPHRRMKAHIERYDLGHTYCFLLARGSLLNLASGTGYHSADMFDHYTAVMLVGIGWMFDGIPDAIDPGLQPYPAHLERQIAELSIQLHS